MTRQAKAPGLLSVGIATALLGLGVTAFSPEQPPPPPTAEYAPEAVRALRSAPPEQTSQSGTRSDTGDASGGERGSRPTASPPPTARSSALPGGGPTLPPLVKERVRRCVGEPPRQVEDPQSPPCADYWGTKPNGGSTWRGVGPTVIRVAIPNADDIRRINGFIRFFNRRFELYGRQIKPVYDVGCFGAGSPDAQKQKAKAVADLEVFASVGFCDGKGLEYPFFDELSRLGVVTLTNRPIGAPERMQAARHPYWWSYLPSLDVGAAHLGELACSLRGRNAEYAGPAHIGAQRRFGLITNTFDGAPDPDVSTMLATMRACGATPERAEVRIESDSPAGQGASGQTTQQVAVALQRFRDSGVTTVISFTHYETTRQVWAQADAQGYQPEHVVSNYYYNESDVVLSQAPTSQSAHTFGIDTWNRTNRVGDEYWKQALAEADPTYPYTYAPFDYFGARQEYTSLLMLAAGLQQAGPNLTPQSFANGLQSTTWPNPASRLHPGRVSVQPGQHSYVTDAAVWWFDPARPNREYDSSGSRCYVDNGTRRRLGGYPREDGIQKRPCLRS